MINKDILEETQEILINCIETFKELTEENAEERMNFVKKALKHLNDNVLKDKEIESTNNFRRAENELLKKIKRNTIALSYAALIWNGNTSLLHKKEMLTSWLTYYVKQIDVYLRNGR